MDTSKIELIAMVGWKHEDELPDWIDDEIYAVLYPSSRVPAPVGCRQFPFVSICGKEIFLILD